MKELEIRCNLCGNPFNLLDYTNNFRIETKVGYGSKYDTDTVNLHICCQCFDSMVEKCTITPIKKERG